MKLDKSEWQTYAIVMIGHGDALEDATYNLKQNPDIKVVCVKSSLNKLIITEEECDKNERKNRL